MTLLAWAILLQVTAVKVREALMDRLKDSPDSLPLHLPMIGLCARTMSNIELRMIGRVRERSLRLQLKIEDNYIRV